MDKRAWSLFAFGLVVGCLLCAAFFIPLIRGGSGGGDRTVIKLAHVLDRAHPVHVAMEFMDRRLRELSGGTVELLIIPNSPLGSETECLSQVRSGALEMTKVSAAALETFVPEMAVFSLPYLFRDHGHFWRVLDGPIGDEILAAGARVGVHGLCYYDSGSRSFYTIGKPVLTPEDVRGKKIRVMQSPMAMQLIRTLGGAPTPVAFGELYTALQQGMVDGAENNEPSYETSRHFEVARHYSLDEHTSIPDVVLFSRQVWERLPAHVQKWIQQAADESSEFQRELWAESTGETLKRLEAAGVSIHRPDKAPFVEASAPMYAEFEGGMLGELARRIREVE